MNKIVADLREKIRPKAPDVRESLSRRLAGMVEGLSRQSESGCVMAPEDVAELTRRMRETVRQARALESEKRQAVLENRTAIDACQLLYNAEDAFAGTRTALRERLHEAEVDPTGMIRASLDVGLGYVAQVEALLAGGRMQS